jgi:hypothetical protein
VFGCVVCVDPSCPAVVPSLITDPCKLLVGPVIEVDGGEDDIIAGEDDEVTAGGRAPGSDAVWTFGGRG